MPTKDKSKDKGYIFRHLEEKVRNLETERQLLEAERLRLEQELKRLRNEFDRERLKLKQDHKISTKKNNELISHLNSSLSLSDHSIRTLNNTMNQLNTENKLLNAKCLRQERSLNYLKGMISKIRESPLDAASIIDSFDQSILLTEPKSDFEKVRKLKILPLKIVLFGDDFPGKNTLIQRFLIPLYDQTKTLGADFAIKVLTVDGQKIKLQIWVFSGEERFRSSLPTYLRGAQGGMFLFDVTNRGSIDHIDDWLSVIRKEIRAEDRFPILALGVVPDEYSSAIPDEQVTSEEAIKIAKSRKLNGFIECTPKTGEKVEKAFEALTRLILDI